MVVGVCQLELVLNGTYSLKAKRQVVKSLITKTRQKFNVSIAEVDSNDLWQRLTMGFSIVGNEGKYVNSMLNKVVDFIQDTNMAHTIDYHIEILNYNDIKSQ